ncbi:MAG: hypothetical protein CSA31_00870 [Desulfobulbus propionicus]|nr:MAG: hypothetical protein CSA31_00870 [Desulfobulbus propionicus]
MPNIRKRTLARKSHKKKRNQFTGYAMSCQEMVRLGILREPLRGLVPYSSFPVIKNKKLFEV